MIKVRHIAIRTKDMDKSLAFYRDVLGLSYVRSTDLGAGQAIDLTDGETNLRLLPTQSKSGAVQKSEGSSGSGLDHIGFLVDDVNYVYNRLKKARVEFITQAPADFFKVLDPDGVVIDITSPTRGW